MLPNSSTMKRAVLLRSMGVLGHSLTFACALLAVLLLAPSLRAQTSPIPYDQLSGPSFSLAPLSYAYPGKYKSIHDVDFRNLTVTFWTDKNGERQLFHLRNGKCKVDFVHDLLHTSIELAGIHYLSSALTGREYALVLYEEDSVGGSSSQDGIAQVFELAGQRLRVAQQIDWDLHYGGPFGPLDTFKERTKALSIRSSHYLPGDGHCCVSAVDVVTYRWDGTQFHQTALRTELSDYGRGQGKKLGPERR